MSKITEAFDKGYILGVFNVSGIEGLDEELKRLKKIGRQPHDVLATGSEVMRPIDYKMENMDPEFQKILNEHFWDLLGDYPNRHKKKEENDEDYGASHGMSN